MHIHILGICGTFMGSLALIAKQLGHEVTGADIHCYPPMSDQLTKNRITLIEGYDYHPVLDKADCIIVGNTMRRGQPAIEYAMNHRLRFMSGPQWLYENVLRARHVIAVAGTHGKTTTTSMVAWILEANGLSPSFLIGGVPHNFENSARLTDSNYFVIEADEYDTALFDKRSKFLHYQPNTLILNNLEYDHADIFPDLDAIKRQFHHLLRTVPSEGKVISADDDLNLSDVLEQGCWASVETFALESGDWSTELLSPDGASFRVFFKSKFEGEVHWSLLGLHNVKNALAAIAAARDVGVSPESAIQALCKFQGVKRRLEVRGKIRGVTVYDDFAHHPTAIRTTLQGLRDHVQEERIIAVVDFASNSMRQGAHNAEMSSALTSADKVIVSLPTGNPDHRSLMENLPETTQAFDTVEGIVDALLLEVRAGDHVVMMSNKGFGNIHQKFLGRLEK